MIPDHTFLRELLAAPLLRLVPMDDASPDAPGLPPD